MILHTLNASPSSSAFRDCLAVLGAGDALLLLGDGVYAGITAAECWQSLLASGATLHVLHDDALAAGILSQVDSSAVIDMAGFVQLSEQYARQLAWY